MWRWLTLSIASTLALSIIIGTAVYVGRQQPLPERLALLHLDMCEPPCWIGITPGKTTWEEAREKIIQTYGIDYYVSFDDEIYKKITLQSKTNIDDANSEFLILVTETLHDPKRVTSISFAVSELPTIASLYSLLGNPSGLGMPPDTDLLTFIYGNEAYMITVGYKAGFSDRLDWTFPAYSLSIMNGVYPYCGTSWRGYRKLHFYYTAVHEC